MSKTEFLYWFRDNPDRPITQDIEWAATRFQKRFNRVPECILVSPKEEDQFKEVKFNIKSDDKIQEGYFGVA